MKSAQLRQLFLDYFSQREHTLVASAPLVPHGDATLLFTNAGMVPFKDVFLGQDKRSYVRAVSAQRCMRAGGKHNDLDNVGYTARHHTFFEMLGNFSFGDYFKERAIELAWGFLTQSLKLPKEKLWITVYQQDDEAAELWQHIAGLPEERIIRCDEKDNFWSMGDTGPCGPCTEIFYDHGESVPGGLPGSPDADGDRYVEIWNLVFMQYNRLDNGELQPLPNPSVDTGMGLERLAAVMQGVSNNYDTDLFQPLLKAAADVLSVKPNEDVTSLCVIADHIRACAFLMTDGVYPANEGRGYVLRRIIRRAVRHGAKLGAKAPFLHQLVAPLVKEMGVAYPELQQAQQAIEAALLQEEQQFARTLSQGLRLLEQAMQSPSSVLSGDVVFKLYDTYGFPTDLTADIARERGFKVDQKGFEQAMAKQRARSQAASSFQGEQQTTLLSACAATPFVGYDRLQAEAQIVQLYTPEIDTECASLQAGEQGCVVLDKTPFYAESGGQIGDRGLLCHAAGGAEAEVLDTTRQNNVFLHHIKITRGQFKIGDVLHAKVDADRRSATAANHSAAHLMHAALREILGEHVKQKGSLVTPEKLRFDYAHFKATTDLELAAIEDRVNAQIRANTAVETELMPLQSALKSGALALFDEKYGDEVRVLRMGGDFSVELCGGTHVKRTGDLGVFMITDESSIAAGVRRIEACTAEGALKKMRSERGALSDIAAMLKIDVASIGDKVQQLLNQQREREKQMLALTQELAGYQGEQLLQQAQTVGDFTVLATQVKQESADPTLLRDMVVQLKEKQPHRVIVLAGVVDGKIHLVAGVSKSDSGRVHAGKLIKEIAAKVGGSGGGRPDIAQAGGHDVAQLDAALAAVIPWLENL